MSFADTIPDRAMFRLCRYVMHAPPSLEQIAALTGTADGATDYLRLDDVAEVGDALARARERPQIESLCESLTAAISRALCLKELETEGETADPYVAKWISNNITAGRFHTGRARAIWRHFAGVDLDAPNDADAGDGEVTAHAIQSARLGNTQKPIPRAQRLPETPSETGKPKTPLRTGKEDTMIDPTPIRNLILQEFAFNPAGLPPALRKVDHQKVYVDAVVTSVALLGHGPKGGTDTSNHETENLAKWSSATAAILLLDGHYDPQDSKFYAHVQKAVAELASSASEGNQIQIDGHGLRDGMLVLGDTETAENDMQPLTIAAPNAETQRIHMFVTARNIIGRRLGEGDKVFLQSWAVAGRKAVDTYADHAGDTTILTPTVDSAYNSDISAGGSGGGGGGIANVELPPLNDPSGHNDEIERENVRAVSTIYVSYQLEFAIAACARVLELFVAGLLPIPASDGSARELDSLYWDQEDFLDEASRRSIYARVLGAPGGELTFDIQPNTEFNTLLLRTVSTISEYERELSAITHFDNAARGRRFQTTSGELVRKAIRDFAANVSLRGWAGTAFTAERLAKQIRRVMKVLGLPAVRNAFGVTTPWQVIERVSQREFGITVNTVLHRTLADETQKIMRVIADNHTIWSNTSGGSPLFTEAPNMKGDLSWDDGRQLVVSAQHFRAVAGLGDGLIDEYAGPVEVSAQPSLPIGGGMAGMTGGGGNMPGVDVEGINALRDMVSAGQTPSPDQILSLLPRI